MYAKNEARKGRFCATWGDSKTPRELELEWLGVYLLGEFGISHPFFTIHKLFSMGYRNSIAVSFLFAWEGLRRRRLGFQYSPRLAGLLQDL